MPADFINLVAIIIIAGVLLGLVNSFIPMPGAIRSLLNILVVGVLIVYILQFFGLVHTGLPVIQIFR